MLTREGCLLVDPVRLDDAALGVLPRPVATLLTARCHQRAAWRYRKELGAEVWLPEDASAGDEKADKTYVDGGLLPGGLRAFRTPGPEWPHYSFLSEGDPGHHLLLGPAEQRRGRAAFHRPGLPRGSGDDAGERRAPARAAVRHPVPGARNAGHRRPQGRDPQAAGPAGLTRGRDGARRLEAALSAPSGARPQVRPRGCERRHAL